MVDQSQHISIGRFAGLTGISANTLRRYDELGLLSPAVIDPDTRYRRYSIEQLDAGILIRLLRDLDVPLEQVKTLVATGSADDVRKVLTAHRRRVVERHAELERILARLDAVLDEDRGLLPYEVELVALQPQWVVSRRVTTERARLDAELERCLGQLEDELAAGGAAAAGRELVLYHNVLQWYRGLDMEVCLPVDEAVAPAHGGWHLPGGAAVRTLFRGPWDDIWHAYSAMLARIAREGYEVCGPARERYLADERDVDDPQRYVTELTWPVQPRAT
jgi:DNA-binding transcriptional MerR regulator